ncbi:COMM domain-containing protein 2-like [Planococcus citri]|uniref:COMM domain-containing protein 2-like n=1 Tax=Planococcus citri TaxID=170843 RepID=UPI0031F728F8
MALFLTETHKEHLNFLCQHQPDTLRKFGGAAIEYISKGPDGKDYTKVAKRFDVPVERIKNSLESLAYIIIECSKLDIQTDEFVNIFHAAGFTDDQSSSLIEPYLENKKIIADIFQKTDSLSYFYDLQWRFESKISSRALLNQVTPLVTMNLKLSDSSSAVTSEKTTSHLLQTDPSTLVHLTETLEKALQESRPHNIRKIQRKIKKITIQDS